MGKIHLMNILLIIVIIVIGVFITYTLIKANNEKSQENENILIEEDSTEPVIEIQDSEEETQVNNEITPTNTTSLTYQALYPEKINDIIIENPDIIIIDASTKYNAGHLINSLNYPLNTGILEQTIPTLQKDKMYLVYSSSDVEGKKAAQMLVDAGFTNVYMLKGSYGFWLQSGYDYEK